MASIFGRDVRKAALSVKLMSKLLPLFAQPGYLFFSLAWVFRAVGKALQTAQNKSQASQNLDSVHCGNAVDEILSGWAYPAAAQNMPMLGSF